LSKTRDRRRDPSTSPCSGRDAWEGEIPEPSHRLRQVVDAFDGLEDIVIVFGANGRPRVGEQQLDEGVKKSDVGFGRLKREWIDARSVLTDPIDPASIQFDHALVAAADIEDEGEATVLLFQAQHLALACTLLPVPVGPMMSCTRTPFT
jgi:hypothetical protein